MAPTRTIFIGCGLAIAAGATGCHSAAWHRARADRDARAVVDAYYRKESGAAAPFEWERPADTLRRRLLAGQDLPTRETLADAAVPGAGVYKLTLLDALKIGTRNSREYQKTKEDLFTAALELDLEANAFRTQWKGVLAGSLTEDRSAADPQRTAGLQAGATAARALETGVSVTTQLAFDLAKLLTLDRESAYGLLADATITVPLLRGSGRDLVREPLTQAERNTQYALWTFERFRRDFAVNVANDYLAALQTQAGLLNYAENLRSLEEAAKRADQLARAGRLPSIQVDQARQDELRARERYVAAQQGVERALDKLKLTLGLPVDARIELEAGELERLNAIVAKMEKDAVHFPAWVPAEPEALKRALDQRLDLRLAQGRVEDARRAVRIAGDALRAGLALKMTGRAGGAADPGAGDTKLEPDRGVYGATLALDPPWERTAERVQYRTRLIEADRAARALESAEDTVKSQVRDALRSLLQAREGCRIQTLAVDVARRRVDSTRLLQEAGRVEIRYLLEARESLLSAQLALTQAVVQYRLAELELLRDMEALAVNEEGLWNEPQ